MVVQLAAVFAIFKYPFLEPDIDFLHKILETREELRVKTKSYRWVNLRIRQRDLNLQLFNSIIIVSVDHEGVGKVLRMSSKAKLEKH